MTSKISLNIFHIKYVYILDTFFISWKLHVIFLCFPLLLFNNIIPVGSSFRENISCYLVKIIRIMQRLIADRVKWIARKLFRAIYNHDWCGAIVAMMHCGAIYTDTKNMKYALRNPSDSSELYLYLTYAAGIKGITVYLCFSEENSRDATEF